MIVILKIFISKILLLNYKEESSLLTLSFYLLIIAIYPFTSNLIIKTPSNSINIIWISLLFSILLTLENLFHKDYEDGSLDLYYLSNIPLDLIVFLKSLIHWGTIGFPIVVITPCLFILFNIKITSTLILGLLFATFNLVNISVICASLTLSLKQRGVLLSLITLPLSIPTLIFSLSSLSIVTLILNFFVVISITPLITSYILRLSFE